jgi:hypothetical protein
MGEERTDPAGNLARELENLILSLDRIEGEAATLRSASNIVSQPPAPEAELPEHEPDLDDAMSAFRDDVFDHLTEIARSMRFLSNLIRVNHAEVLNELLRTEQSLQDEINQAEKRIRGDLATLRWDLVAGDEPDDADETSTAQ